MTSRLHQNLLIVPRTGLAGSIKLTNAFGVEHDLNAVVKAFVKDTGVRLVKVTIEEVVYEDVFGQHGLPSCKDLDRIAASLKWEPGAAVPRERARREAEQDD